jgi:hypothetical protein
MRIGYPMRLWPTSTATGASTSTPCAAAKCCRMQSEHRLTKSKGAQQPSRRSGQRGSL